MERRDYIVEQWIGKGQVKEVARFASIQPAMECIWEAAERGQKLLVRREGAERPHIIQSGLGPRERRSH